MVWRWNRKIFDQFTPCATRLQLPLKQLLRPCIGRILFWHCELLLTCMLSRPIMLRLSRVQLPKIFLSGLYLPAVPSSTLRRVSRAVMALISHAYPPCHDCQCIFPCVLFSFTRCLNSCHGNRKPGSEEGAFSHPQRNVDLSTPIPSTYACSRPYSRPLCYAYSLCSFRAG